MVYFSPIYIIAYTLVYLIFAFAFSCIFKKANEGRWKAYVPVYNIYTLFKIVWDVKYFWFALALGVIAGACAYYCYGMGALADVAEHGSNALIMAVSILLPVSGIGILILYIMLCGRITAAFGLTKGWTFFLVVLFPAIIMVIGIGWPEFKGSYKKK